MEIASSIRLLIRNKPALATSKSLLLIGDPIKATNEYPSLVYAQKEMKEISKLFPVSKIKVYSGKNATPSAYFSSDPSQYEVIDFVTHGYASVIRPLDSAIILSLESSPASPTGKRFRLLARDILRKPIHARMVVISACYGAGTRSYSSEGLVGLAWAFLRAGAHQVIAGLWDVDDEVTPELMKNFYSEWLKSKVPSQALRSAKLKMIRSHTGDHRPYYWGSLQLYTGS